MWRKTRSNPHGHSGGRCVGADPNRNWEYRWGGPGASKNPCTETYMGTGPFSEAETRAASQFVFHHRKDIQVREKVQQFPGDVSIDLASSGCFSKYFLGFGFFFLN